MTIPKGSFTCIIGDVGSGKSSFLSALIGDLMYMDPDFLEHFEDKNMLITDSIAKDIKENFKELNFST